MTRTITAITNMKRKKQNTILNLTKLQY